MGITTQQTRFHPLRLGSHVGVVESDKLPFSKKKEKLEHEIAKPTSKGDFTPERKKQEWAKFFTHTHV